MNGRSKADRCLVFCGALGMAGWQPEERRGMNGLDRSDRFKSHSLPFLWTSQDGRALPMWSLSEPRPGVLAFVIDGLLELL